MHARYSKGYTLVEVLIGVVIFVMITTTLYQGFAKTLQATRQSKIKVDTSAIAFEQFEIIRNLDYDNIGLIGGVPSGVLEPVVTVDVQGREYTVTRTIRNIDDPQDGTFGGTPNDQYPIDSKLAHVEITCAACTTPVEFTTRITPPVLEDLGDNGVLTIIVHNALGQPVSGASVHVENNDEDPAISINDTTNNDGELQIIGVPAGTEAYEITVTKDGYSTDQTYEPGDPENPSPHQPHANIVTGQETSVIFQIDQLSAIVINTMSPSCSSVGGVDVNVQGSREIGDGVYKVDNDYTSNGSGVVYVNDVEWDTYEISVTDSSYVLAGASRGNIFEVNPSLTETVDVIVAPDSPNNLLIRVQDSGSGLPIGGATVTLSGAGSGSDTTTAGALFQTNWAGGDGQTSFSDTTRFYSSDGNIDYTTMPGSVTLDAFLGAYPTTGYLISSTFSTGMGTTTNYHSILFEPQNTNLDHDIRLQLASSQSNTATTTWIYRGPDGSTGSYYYRWSESDIYDGHDGDQYFRYKLYLDSDNASSTPTISDMAILYGDTCIPPGEVFFQGLSSGSYTITVEHPDYETYSVSGHSVTNDWQKITIPLVAN